MAGRWWRLWLDLGTWDTFTPHLTHFVGDSHPSNQRLIDAQLMQI